jgi:hypothetical protein
MRRPQRIGRMARQNGAAVLLATGQYPALDPAHGSLCGDPARDSRCPVYEPALVDTGIWGHGFARHPVTLAGAKMFFGAMPVAEEVMPLWWALSTWERNGSGCSVPRDTAVCTGSGLSDESAHEENRPEPSRGLMG